MRVRIHRGAAEIGGSCVELEASGDRLLLDLGRPLTADWDEPIPLPDIAGLTRADPSLLGVVISHAHPDHYGLAADLPAAVPLFIGAAAERVLRESHFFGAAGVLPAASGYLSDREPLELGPFRVTSLLVDHSAFDAYAVLVEADGRRLLYSGDLRGHGRKRGAFERFLAAPPTNVGALLLEGTRLSRRPGRGCDTEDEVEEQIAEAIRSTDGLLLALYSPQNVDRYVSVFKAARRAKRTLVIDLYTAAVARATDRGAIPQAGWDGIRVYVPQAQRVRVKEAAAFERVNELGASRIYLDEIGARPSEFVLTFRSSMIHELERAGLEPSSAIWSMWPGYLEAERSEPLLRYLSKQETPLEVIHASGHATVDDLRRFAAAVAPARVVPIHTEVPERYAEIYDRIEAHADGEWWEV